MPQITIDIDENGKSTIAVSGMVGNGCFDVTRALEKALGTKLADRQTADFWRVSNTLTNAPATQAQDQAAGEQQTHG